jgi:putative transposase
MPNHIHVIVQPLLTLPTAIAWIKACSARDANRILGRSHHAFWARNYFDRWIRNSSEERQITGYIEQNPVKAKLCLTSEDWPWSSAAGRSLPDTR